MIHIHFTKSLVRIRRHLTVAFFLAIFATVPGLSQEKKEETTKTKLKTEHQNGGGYVVQIEPGRGPVEGTQTLSQEMREALQRLVSTSSEGLKEVTLSDGTVLVDLQGRFKSATVVTIGPDGKLKTQCVTTPPEPQTKPEKAPKKK